MSAKLHTDTLIKSLKPSLHEGIYVFCTVKEIPAVDTDSIICLFRESEGITIILRKEVADKARLLYSYQAAWITLSVHTSLSTIGITAAFSRALAEKGISCNVVAGFYHDHLFVPKDKAAEAMKVLNRLSF
jgi:uncharacterized protein